MPAHRDTIHDLRNLFGIISSAGHMLERQTQGVARRKLLDAIEGAAMRGGLLTTDLLVSPQVANVMTFDANARVAGLEPMIRALIGHNGSVRIELDDVPLILRLDAAAFDAAILELVTNAAKAGASHIIVRSLLTGSRARFLVADNADGMSAATLLSAMRGSSLARAHGSGLSRVLHFVRVSNGHLRIRTRERRGTVVSMNLPVVLSATAGKHGAPAPSPRAKDIHHENRRANSA
jgi:signal transduction histidine kinase